jgi:hypothetical protein
VPLNVKPSPPTRAESVILSVSLRQVLELCLLFISFCYFTFCYDIRAISRFAIYLILGYLLCSKTLDSLSIFLKLVCRRKLLVDNSFGCMILKF